MKKNILIVSLLAWCLGVQAQQTLPEILQQVQQNNLQLQAAGYAVKSEKAELAAANNLEDPEVEYVHQWGSPVGVGKETELTVTQGFDFPTAYVQRNKYKQLQGQVVDRNLDATWQQIRLETATLYVELVGLNRQAAVLQKVVDNLQQQTQRLTQAQLAGDATLLEVNKLKMSLLGVQGSLQQNHAQYQAGLQQLLVLNGGKALTCESKEYPQWSTNLQDANALVDDFKNHDAAFLQLTDLVTASGQLVKVKQAEALPKLKVGYQRNTATGETLNGVVGGVSIPIFSNRHKVKSAKAAQQSMNLQLEDKQHQAVADVMSLYNQKEQLRLVLEGFDSKLLDSQVDLLGKALDLGELTILDYLTEMQQTLSTQQEYQDLEQQYQQLCCQLAQYQL